MEQASTGATAAVDRALRQAVADPGLLAAGEALAGNDIPRAEALLRSHLKRRPADVAAIRMMAELAARIGRHEDACALLERCLELAPGFDAARQNYAMVLHRANRPDDALAQIGYLLDRDPRNPAYRNLKAVVLCRTGDYAEAVSLFEGILAEHPGQARVWLSHGHALKTAGQGERAIAAYRRCAQLEPGFGDAWWSLANLKTFRFDDADVATMQGQLARADLGDDDRVHLSFALGKALEDRGEHAAAFESYAHGNALRLARVPYSADENSARLRRAAEIYTEALFREREGQGCLARDPIFVVGMPRAGSTLVEQILASHPLVEGTMELPEITSIARVLRRQAGDAGSPARYHEAVAQLDGEDLRAAGERYIERTRIQRKTGAPFFVDKMPNNFAHVGLIRLALPNAKIVDVRRHPMACGFSLFKQHFARGQDFSYSLPDIGRYYRDYVAYMAHFDRVQPGRILRVAYEDLVGDTEAQVRRLLDHCGLPFDEACLRFFENERPVRTASSEQVRRPIYREGLDHWKRFETWLQPLRQVLGDLPDASPVAAGGG
jgi:tetratricopeptide (TPR) repeat protein